MFLSKAILIYQGFIQPYFDYCADEFLLSAFSFPFLLQSCRSNIMTLLYTEKPGDTENAGFVVYFRSERSIFLFERSLLKALYDEISIAIIDVNSSVSGDSFIRRSSLMDVMAIGQNNMLQPIVLYFSARYGGTYKFTKVLRLMVQILRLVLFEL